MAIPVMESPGVYINEVDESQYTSLAGTSKVVGLVGAAQAGPIGVPTRINSKTAFINTFGAPIDFAGLAATKYLNWGSNLIYLRVAGDSATSREVKLAGTGKVTPPGPVVNNITMASTEEATRLATGSFEGLASQLTYPEVLVYGSGNSYTLALTGSYTPSSSFTGFDEGVEGSVIPLVFTPPEEGWTVKGIARGTDKTPGTFDGDTSDGGKLVFQFIPKDLTPDRNPITVTYNNGSSDVEYSYTIDNKNYTPTGGVSVQSTSPIEDALIITYKSEGTIFPEPITASVSTVDEETPDMFNLVITKGENTTLVNRQYSCDPESSSFIGKDTTTPFIFTVAENVASINEVSGAMFSTGNNGLPLSDEILVNGINMYSDSETYNIDILAAPGYYSRLATNALVNVATDRKDCVALLDYPQDLDPGQVVARFAGEAAGWQDDSDGTPLAVDTSYAAVHYPWCQTVNEYTGENEWVPSTVAVIAAISEEYADNYAWTAPAGNTKFKLSIVNGIQRNLLKADRDTLYKGRINPLCNYKQLGYTSMGQKTLQIAQTALDRLNVRFLINYIKKMADEESVKYLFTAIDSNTWASWVQVIGAKLETIRQNGGLYDYKVTMDETTVTNEMINNNIMPGVIEVKPTKSAEYIPIDVVIRNIDDEFGS